MQLSSKSPATRAALLYITIGAVAIVWTIIWIVYLMNHPPHSSGVYYLCAGCLATGVIVLLIGVCIGSIGRTARDAESPNVVTPPVQQIQPVVTAAPTVNPNPAPALNGTVASTPTAVPPGVSQAATGIAMTADGAITRAPAITNTGRAR